MTFCRALGYALIALVSACTEPVDELVVSLSADRQVATPGDPVRLLASVFNPTSSTLEIGSGCGPSLDFRVTEPGGVTRSLLEGLVFTCPLLDYHILVPGETDSIPWTWSAPTARGTYTFRSAVRTASGPRHSSPPVAVTVH
jgi:hypothetical protein